MQEVQKNRKYENIFVIMALVIFVVVLASVLVFPLMQGSNIGNGYGAVLDMQVFREYEYDEYDDYYYPSDKSPYQLEDDYDDYDIREKAEREERKIGRDVKHINEFDDSITFSNEVTLLAKYIKYIAEVKEEELMGFRYAFGFVVLILVAALALIFYTLSSFMLTLLSLIRGKIELSKVQGRVCKLLFFFIPFILAINWQRNLVIQMLARSHILDSNMGGDLEQLGLGCIVSCAMIAVYLLVYWGMDIQVRLRKDGVTERFVVNRLVLFLMMAAAGGALLMNFTNAMYGSRGTVKSVDLVAKAARQVSEIDYQQELYELKYEKEEEDRESRREEESYFEDFHEIYALRLTAGFVLLVGVMITVWLLYSINKTTYLNREVIRHRVLAGINVACGILAWILISKSNALEMETMEDLVSASEKRLLRGEFIGMGVILPMILNAFVIVADIWRKYITKFFDKRMNASGEQVALTNGIQRNMEQME